MPRLIFIEAAGERAVEAASGVTVMQAAVGADVAGIIGECGGCATCMTCHAYLDPEQLALVPPPDVNEAAMLEHLLEVRATSRLTCQIRVTPALDGLRLTLPAREG